MREEKGVLNNKPEIEGESCNKKDNISESWPEHKSTGQNRIHWGKRGCKRYFDILEKDGLGGK